MTVRLRASSIQASYFGAVLGLCGLGSVWRTAKGVWGTPAVVGEILMAIGTLTWLVLLVMFALKWLHAREAALQEVADPIACCFVGLVGVATMLVSFAAEPYLPTAAEGLFMTGALFTLAFAIWRTGGLWQGGRDAVSTTPVLYLPGVAGSFVTAGGLASFGHPGWGTIVIGAGFFSWIAIESVVLSRLLTSPPMPPALRPTLGIQLAPAVVGASAYLTLSASPPDMLAYALLGYGLLQAAILLRLLPWIREQPFSPGYWSFTFGGTALALVPLRMIALGETGAVEYLAPVLFVMANMLVLGVALKSLTLILKKDR